MKATNFKLNIISAEKTVFSGNVNIITLPGALGSFSILPDHAPLVSSLNAGVIAYQVDNNPAVEVEIKGGFVEVSRNIVTVCIE